MENRAASVAVILLTGVVMATSRPINQSVWQFVARTIANKAYGRNETGIFNTGIFRPNLLDWPLQLWEFRITTFVRRCPWDLHAAPVRLYIDYRQVWLVFWLASPIERSNQRPNLTTPDAEVYVSSSCTRWVYQLWHYRQWLKCHRTQGNAVPPTLSNGLMRSPISNRCWGTPPAKRAQSWKYSFPTSDFSL